MLLPTSIHIITILPRFHRLSYPPAHPSYLPPSRLPIEFLTLTRSYTLTLSARTREKRFLFTSRAPLLSAFRARYIIRDCTRTRELRGWHFTSFLSLSAISSADARIGSFASAHIECESKAADFLRALTLFSPSGKFTAEPLLCTRLVCG